MQWSLKNKKNKFDWESDGRDRWTRYTNQYTHSHTNEIKQGSGTHRLKLNGRERNKTSIKEKTDWLTDTRTKWKWNETMQIMMNPFELIVDITTNIILGSLSMVDGGGGGGGHKMEVHIYSLVISLCIHTTWWYASTPRRWDDEWSPQKLKIKTVTICTMRMSLEDLLINLDLIKSRERIKHQINRVHLRDSGVDWLIEYNITSHPISPQTVITEYNDYEVTVDIQID